MKKYRKFLMILIIILFVILVVLAFYNNSDEKIINLKINKSTIIQNDTEIQNYVEFSRNYTGEVNADVFYNKLRTMANSYLPIIKKDLKTSTDDEIKKYYEENSKIIKSNFGIEDYNTFENLVINIKKTKSGNLKIKSVSIEMSNYIENDEFAEFIVYFYTENNEQIDLKVNLGIEDGSIIKFIPVMED